MNDVETEHKYVKNDNMDECKQISAVTKKFKESHVNRSTKIKNKKIKKKKSYQKRTSNIFDLNNFIVQNSSNIIRPKYQHVNIPIPVYKEIKESFYEEDIRNNQLNNQLPNDSDYVIF
jgi:hypothetical protein